MTYKQALIGQPYAKRVNDVLEKLEIKCPECKGSGHIWCPDSGFRVPVGARKKMPCGNCKGTGKVPYSHTPQVGEWVIYKNKVALIVGTYSEAQKLAYGVSGRKIFNKYYDFLLQVDPSGLVPSTGAFISECTPIFEWETIVKILEKAGILLRLRQTPDGWVPPKKFYCDVTILHRDAAQVKEFISLSIADSRIKAVYDAVLELGKEKGIKWLADTSNHQG